MKCSVQGCKSDTNKPNPNGNRISFHVFPLDENLRSQWILAINRKDWLPTKHSRVCSLHFKDSDIFTTPKGFKKIREGACPQLKDHTQDREKTPEPFNMEKFLVPQDSPRKKVLKEEIARLRINERKQKLKIKSLLQNLRRLKKRMSGFNYCVSNNFRNYMSAKSGLVVTSLKSLYEHLQKKNLLNEEDTEVLALTDINIRDLITRHRKKLKNQTVTKKYSPALRMFALTLHYYSPKAYSYVRQKFNTCLPHPRTIAKWFENVNGEAGFTAESFQVLRMKSEKSPEKPICSLVMDEMAIKKHIEWDGKKFHGYVDHGIELSHGADNNQEATQVLVMILVCLTERWKIPVGYFLIHSLTSEQRASLVKQCLYKTHDAGVEVVSLTMDGCAANISMAKKLGCRLTPHDFKSTFKHPCANYDVAVLLDACHMLKLVRNTFEAKSILIDYQGNEIKWKYLKDLNEYQKNEGMHLANKLKDTHINFQRQKMKVKLASQLFSNSVADALVVCQQSHSGFRDVQPTVFFIRLINDLFDILNSRSLTQHECKKPLFEKNIEKTKQFLEFAKKYLTYLTVKDEATPIVDSNRKTGFIGFISCIESTIFLYTRLIENEKRIKFLPTHKLSQDHVELFFGIIRAHGRTNNNPTVRQFKAAYKKILVNTELKDSFNGNCIPLEDIPILHMSSVKKINMSADRYRMSQEVGQGEDCEDDSPIPDDILLEFDSQLDSIVRDNLRRQTITYIAGFVAKSLSKQLKCESCINALYADEYSDDHNLIMTKNKGGLVFPSKDVIKICKNTESSLRTFISQETTTLTKQKIVTHTMKALIGQDCFKILDDHVKVQSPLNNHSMLLCQCISEKYVDIRLNHLAVCKNIKDSKRQLLNKTVLFMGQ